MAKKKKHAKLTPFCTGRPTQGDLRALRSNLLPTRLLRLPPLFELIGSPVTAEVRRNGPKMGRKASERAALCRRRRAELCAREAEEGKDVAVNE